MTGAPASLAAPAARRRASPYRLTAPVVPEHSLQKQICDVLRIEIAPPGKVSKHGVVWWAVDHANYAGEVPGIRIGRGIVAGLTDLFVLYQGRAYFPEIKTPVGVLSDAQQAVAAAVLAAGGRCAVVRDAADMLVALDAWGVPRARRVPL
jgi:hypothetical protein